MSIPGVKVTRITTDPGYVTITMPQDEHGFFIDMGRSGPEWERVEDHLLQNAAALEHYAEQGNTVGDPHTASKNGVYDCGPVPSLNHDGCNKFRNGKCTAVQGPIKGDHGSCTVGYENHNLGDFETDLGNQKLTKEEAGYAERPGPKPATWSCADCENGSKSKAGSSSTGRSLFCRVWGSRVQPKACCGKNHMPGDIEFEENEPVKQDLKPKIRVLGVAMVRHKG